MTLLFETPAPVVEPRPDRPSARLTAALRWLRQLAKAIHGRRVVADLATLDDRVLRDIGLTRSDLRDTAAVPLLQDPTVMLFERARERRAARGRHGGADRADNSGARARRRFVPYY